MPASKINRTTWLKNATDRLRLARINSLEPRLDAELILSHVLNIKRLELHTNPLTELPPKIQTKADHLLELRSTGYPLVYILGYKEFYGRNFLVTPDVLVPRPETESLVEIALQKLQNWPKNTTSKIADIGTGSGAIGLTLGLESKCHCQIDLIDIGPKALQVCQKNADLYSVLNTKFVQNNLLENCNKKYHLIAANLPYVDRTWQFGDEIKHEPAIALFAEKNGLELIFKLIDQIVNQQNLESNGCLLLESDPIQQPAIAAKLTQAGFDKITHSDFVTVATWRQ